MITDANDKNFAREVIGQSALGNIVLVVAYAEWCPDSKRILGLLEKIDQEFGSREKVLIIRIMIEDAHHQRINPLIHDAFDVSRYPKLILFTQGRILEKFSEGHADSQLSDIRAFINLGLEQ